MDYPKFIVSKQKEESISILRVKVSCTADFIGISVNNGFKNTAGPISTKLHMAVQLITLYIKAERK